MRNEKSSNLEVTNSLIENVKCPITAFLMLVGGKWKPIILYSLSLGPRRFGEIDVRIHGISRKVLTEQLKELERDGFVTRRAYRETPPRVEYELTEEGLSLATVFDSMEAWINQYKKNITL